MSWLAWGFALLAGALITVQAGANSQLKQSLDAPLMVLVVTGQLLCAALLDHFGWISFEVHPAGRAASSAAR